MMRGKDLISNFSSFFWEFQIDLSPFTELSFCTRAFMPQLQNLFPDYPWIMRVNIVVQEWSLFTYEVSPNQWLKRFMVTQKRLRFFETNDKTAGWNYRKDRIRCKQGLTFQLFGPVWYAATENEGGKVDADSGRLADSAMSASGPGTSLQSLQA